MNDASLKLVDPSRRIVYIVAHDKGRSFPGSVVPYKSLPVGTTAFDVYFWSNYKTK